MLHLSRVEPSHEDLFLRRYDALVAWASSLCTQDSQHAEDLVHDAFLAFTVGRPDLDEIDNLDGYLRGMLRKLHLSATRRVARRALVSLSVLEYESADLGLRAIGAATVEAQHDLACICRYACARKSSSKAASILTLRFFHGYFPSEIAQVARCSARATDEWLRIARREARLFRDAPHRLRFLSGDRQATAVAVPAPGAAEDPARFLKAIQGAIFEARSGRCPRRRELESLYASTSESSIEAPGLAHIVSCRRCLDRVNALLGLPSLEDRSPHDMLGPHRGGPGGGSRTGRGPSLVARRREQRWRTAYEHHPLELQVVVNGFLVGSHTVGGPVTKQTVAVTFDEPVGLVEVFGERGIALACLDVQPQPSGRVEQSISVALSEDRRLRARISFARPWPEVDVEYEDPHWRKADVVHDHGEPRRLDPQPASRASRRPWTVGMRLLPQHRWRLALAVGCLTLFMLVAPGATLRAAEYVAHTATAVARALIALSQGIWKADGSPRPIPKAVAATAMPPAIPTDVLPPVARVVLPPPPSAAALARAEVDALVRLDRVGALLGGQIDVRKQPRYVLVRGLVPDEPQKARVEQALLPLRRARLVRADVSTVSEQLRREPAPSEPAVRYQPMVFETGGIPLGDPLRAALRGRGEWAHADPPALEVEIRRIATTVLDRSLDARLHGAVLQSLATRDPGGELRTIDAQAYDAWRALVASHARALLDDVRYVRELIEPLLVAPSALAGQSTSTARDAPGPARPADQRAQQLAAYAVTFDEAMRAGLSVSSAPPAPPLRLQGAAFWESVRQAERLAEDLAK
ncbi:MAG TPA: hypothetical protein VG871_07450 [Vicinamibacterales bacterium]|nr:hypothetical protein [Vicinamibacterales bacterium]